MKNEEMAAKIRKQSIAALVWSILAICFSVGIPFNVNLFGVPILGLLLGITSYIRSRMALKWISQHPDINEHQSMARAANICAMVALGLSLVGVVWGWSAMLFL